jgi:hypothetical protein
MPIVLLAVCLFAPSNFIISDDLSMRLLLVQSDPAQKQNFAL